MNDLHLVVGALERALEGATGGHLRPGSTRHRGRRLFNRKVGTKRNAGDSLVLGKTQETTDHVGCSGRSTKLESGWVGLVLKELCEERRR